MKASKSTEVQIAFILKQADGGTLVARVWRKAGISDATFYYWWKKYAGLMPSEMKRLRKFEDENAKLKRIVLDLSLDKLRRGTQAEPTQRIREICATRVRYGYHRVRILLQRDGLSSTSGKP